MSIARRRRIWNAAMVGFVLSTWAGGAVRGDEASAPRLYIEPIPGLTTVRHPAPEAITIPRGVTLTVCHGSRASGSESSNGGDRPRDGSDITAAVQTDSGGSGSPSARGWQIAWTGAREIRRDDDMAWANCPTDVEGEFTIHARGSDASGNAFDHGCRVKVVDVGVDRIRVRGAVPHVGPFTLGEYPGNGDTMRAFFGESVAKLTRVPEARGVTGRGRKGVPAKYRTSINRAIEMDVVTDPPGFESLMEVRSENESARLAASNPRPFHKPGVYRVAVGPPGRDVQLEFEIYKVQLRSHPTEPDASGADLVVTLDAVTDPPGFENEVTWVSSTKYGTATPVLGQGATFTARFDDTFGPNDGMQWLGIRADNAQFEVDESTFEISCNCPPGQECTASFDLQTSEFLGFACQSGADGCEIGGLIVRASGQVVDVVCTSPKGCGDDLCAGHITGNVISCDCLPPACSALTASLVRHGLCECVTDCITTHAPQIGAAEIICVGGGSIVCGVACYLSAGTACTACLGEVITACTAGTAAGALLACMANCF